MDRGQAADVMRVVEEGWAGEMQPETVVLYMRRMGDLPFEPTMQAVLSLMDTERHRPALATIRHAVAQQMGLLPPTEVEALEQARQFLRYKGQLAFVNGSGYSPEKPRVHPAVEATCGPLDGDDDYWPAAFRRMYPEQVTLATQQIVGGNLTQLALGTGDV